MTASEARSARCRMGVAVDAAIARPHAAPAAFRLSYVAHRSLVAPAADDAAYAGAATHAMRTSSSARCAIAQPRPAGSSLAAWLRDGNGRCVGVAPRTQRSGEPLQREHRPRDALVFFAADLPVEHH